MTTHSINPLLLARQKARQELFAAWKADQVKRRALEEAAAAAAAASFRDRMAAAEAEAAAEAAAEARRKLYAPNRRAAASARLAARLVPDWVLAFPDDCVTA